MSTIVTRLGKGSELTYEEMDANLNNLNNDKLESSDATTFTAPQRTSITAEDNAIDFTANNNFTLTATASNITVSNITGCTGQSGVIIINSAENVTGWGAEFIFKTIPDTLTGKETFAYFIEDESNILIGKLL